MDAPINVMQPKEFTSLEIEQVGNGYWGKLDLIKSVKNRLEMQLIDAKRYVEAHQNELFRYLGVKTYPLYHNDNRT